MSRAGTHTATDHGSDAYGTRARAGASSTHGSCSYTTRVLALSEQLVRMRPANHPEVGHAHLRLALRIMCMRDPPRPGDTRVSSCTW